MPSPRRHRPQLTTKTQPAQQRATETFERLLEAAAQTLADVGIERWSTNLVCEHAGVSPPALYRYFPNKYALLTELSRRLMERQNECIAHHIHEGVFAGGIPALEKALAGLLLDTYHVTQQTPGGVWIMRAMRAVPVLQEVRLESHALVTEEQTRVLTQALPGVRKADIRLACRIVVELIYATVEMLCDEPLNAKRVAQVTAGMLASHWTRLLGAAG